MGLVLVIASLGLANGCRMDEQLPAPAAPFEIVVLSDIHLRIPGFPDDRFYDIAAAYRDKILAVFSGHWHMWREYTLFDTIPVYQTGPVGDYWSAGENMAIATIDPDHKTVDVQRHRISALVLSRLEW